MRILVDVCHPAHVHFFKFAIQNWQTLGHEVLVTARAKECTETLLKSLQVPYYLIKCPLGTNIFSFARELLLRNFALYKYAKLLNIDCLTAVGGTTAAHAAFLLRKPSIVFYDSDNAKLQNTITYPFATNIAVPNEYTGRLPKHSIRYKGFHEIAYLHPKYFKLDFNIAYKNGIKSNMQNIFIRRVARTANHDVGTQGLHFEHIRHIIKLMPAKSTNILISSETPLPKDLLMYEYNGEPFDVHHVIGASTLIIGDSTTMAQEAACLGIPALYISNVLPGITLALANDFDLIKTIWPIDIEKLAFDIQSILSLPNNFKQKRDDMFAKHVDVTEFITNYVTKCYEKANTPISNI